MPGDRQEGLGHDQRNKCCITYTRSPFFILQKVEMKTEKSNTYKLGTYIIIAHASLNWPFCACTFLIHTCFNYNFTKAKHDTSHENKLTQKDATQIGVLQQSSRQAKMGGTASGHPSVSSGFAQTQALPRRWLGLTHTQK